jgi:hypothetical protein
MPSVIILSAIMLCHYAECHYGESRSAECCGAVDDSSKLQLRRSIQEDNY